jgi:hypothetical protein
MYIRFTTYRHVHEFHAHVFIRINKTVSIHPLSIVESKGIVNHPNAPWKLRDSCITSHPSPVFPPHLSLESPQRPLTNLPDTPRRNTPLATPLALDRRFVDQSVYCLLALFLFSPALRFAHSAQMCMCTCMCTCTCMEWDVGIRIRTLA